MTKVGRPPTPAHERALEKGIDVLRGRGWTVRKIDMARPNIAIKGKRVTRARSRAVKYFKNKGWRIIPTRGTPEAIGIKNGVVAAIEALKAGRGGWYSFTLKKKREVYSTFDEIIFILFRRKHGKFEIFIREYENPESDIWSEIPTD